MFEIGSMTHIILLLPIFIVYYAGIKCKNYKTMLLISSAVLLLLEVCKQCYYVYTGNWSVWIVPFQLCSTPLYLILFYKYKDHKIFHYLESYIGCYLLLASLAALLYPEDMIKSSVLLTAHSFLWHYLLIYMSSLCMHHAVISFKKATIVFLILCLLATLINIALHSFGEINCFYISPYYYSMQPVFYLIEEYAGRFIRIIIYLLSIIAGSYLLTGIQEVYHGH